MSGQLCLALGAAVSTGTVRPAVKSAAVLVGCDGLVWTTFPTSTVSASLVASVSVGVDGTGTHQRHHLLHLGQ